MKSINAKPNYNTIMTVDENGNIIQIGNIFVDFIYRKQEKNNIFKYLIYKSKLKKFKAKIYNSSPDFDILWQMSDFIKFAEDAFMYPNTQNEYKGRYISLYSSRLYKSNENGFKVINQNLSFENKGDITVKLNKDKKTVAVALTTTESNDRVLWFKDNNWMYKTDNTPENQILLDMIIDMINTEVLTLFDECYDMRLERRYVERHDFMPY